MSFTQNIATQVKRFACDRCHGQKLRCPRRADEGLHEPCVRCCKAGTPCSITTPLRMARHNKSRKLNTGEGVPPRASSPKSNSRSRTKTLETRPLSESDSEDDQLQNHEDIKASIDHTSRSSGVDPTSCNTTPSINTPTFGDTTESATPMVMNDFLQYLNLDLELTEFTNTTDTSMYNDEINGIRTKSGEPRQSEQTH